MSIYLGNSKIDGINTTFKSKGSVDTDNFLINEDVNLSYDSKKNCIILNSKNHITEVDVSKFKVAEAENTTNQDTKRSMLSFYRQLGLSSEALKPITDEIRASMIGMREFASFGTGLFIHWGVYSVPAGRYTGTKQPGSKSTSSNITYNTEWSLRDLGIPLSVYKEYEKDFNTVNWDADTLVKKAKDAGMGYIVITVKHHEGFTLYPTNYGNWDVRTAGKESAQCRTTIIDELKDACDKYELKLGFYFSQYWDWMAEGGFGLEYNGKWNGSTTDLYTDAQHMTYLNKSVLQLKEMCDKYKPFLIWWDPGNAQNDKYQKVYRDLLDDYLNVYIHNDRVQHNRGYGGDFGTGERTICLRDNTYAEACFTMNDTWGYSINNDNKYFGEEKVFKQFMIYSLAYGQNCLMNIGPKSDGSIPDKQLQCLDVMKNFADKYGSFKNYSRVNKRSYPKWGYMLEFPDNVVVCYVITKGNPTTQNVKLDCLPIDNIKSVEILTPTSNSNYSISDNTISIQNLGLDSDTKVGIVRITYSMPIIHLDANLLKCNETLPSRCCPMKSGLTYDFTNYKYTYKAQSSSMESDFVWNDRSEVYNAEILYTITGTVDTVTLTITDLTDSSVTTIEFIDGNKTSEVEVNLVNGRKYTQKVTTTSTDTTAIFSYDGIKFNPKVIHPTSVTLDNDEITLEHNGSHTLTATIIPEDSTDSTVTWTSSNTSVATVDDGVVSAVNMGNTIITVTTNDGGFTAQCSVTINPSEEQTVKHPTSVSLTPKTKTSVIGDIVTLSYDIQPSDATYKTVTWSSNDENVATVSDEGVVTCLSEGTCVITCTTTDGNLTDVCTFTIDSIHVDNVTLDTTTFTTIPGYGIQLTPTITPTNAHNKNVVWTSNNETVATVDENGNVLPHSIGNATITCTSVDGSKTAQCTLTVNAETYDYIWQQPSLDGTVYEEAKINKENIKLFSDSMQHWTLFAHANESVNPNTDTNATLFQCVVNSSPWSGLRCDADNNTSSKNTSTSPSRMRYRFIAGVDVWFNPKSKKASKSGNFSIDGYTADESKHPFAFSRDGNTYKYSFDGIDWIEIKNDLIIDDGSALGNHPVTGQLERLADCILTVGFDYKRSSGNITTTPYRKLKSNNPVVIAIKTQSEYKFHTLYHQYDALI